MQNLEVPEFIFTLGVLFAFSFLFSQLDVQLFMDFVYLELPEWNWSCRTNCNKMHAALQNLIACGEEKLPHIEL